MNSISSTLITALVVVRSMILLLCAGSAVAQNGPASHAFVVASGFLCDPGDSGSCLAVAKSADGDTYEISGAGTFDPQNKSAKAAGTFNHKAANGNLLETGVWLASDLISFDSYGVAPAALLNKGSALRAQQIGPKRFPVYSRPVPTGGLAVFRIVLISVSGATRTAVLQVNCVLGDVPQERSVEGIRLHLDGSDLKYSEEAGGRVMFLSMRHQISETTGTTKLRNPAYETEEKKPVRDQIGDQDKQRIQ